MRILAQGQPPESCEPDREGFEPEPESEEVEPDSDELEPDSEEPEPDSEGPDEPSDLSPAFDAFSPPSVLPPALDPDPFCRSFCLELFP
jgi:hypothetical protein